jgi:hypothetical protein
MIHCKEAACAEPWPRAVSVYTKQRLPCAVSHKAALVDFSIRLRLPAAIRWENASQSTSDSGPLTTPPSSAAHDGS